MRMYIKVAVNYKVILPVISQARKTQHIEIRLLNFGIYACKPKP